LSDPDEALKESPSILAAAVFLDKTDAFERSSRPPFPVSFGPRLLRVVGIEVFSPDY
jgi:hypothetical protein